MTDPSSRQVRVGLHNLDINDTEKSYGVERIIMHEFTTEHKPGINEAIKD